MTVDHGSGMKNNKELSWWDKKLDASLRESFDISERMLEIERNETKLRPKKKWIVVDLHQNWSIH